MVHSSRYGDLSDERTRILCYLSWTAQLHLDRVLDCHLLLPYNILVGPNPPLHTCMLMARDTFAIYTMPVVPYFRACRYFPSS